MNFLPQIELGRDGEVSEELRRCFEVLTMDAACSLDDAFECDDAMTLAVA